MFAGLDTSNDNQMNTRLKSVAQKVIHIVSLHFFPVVFGRISARFVNFKIIYII